MAKQIITAFFLFFFLIIPVLLVNASDRAKGMIATFSEILFVVLCCSGLAILLILMKITGYNRAQLFVDTLKTWRILAAIIVAQILGWVITILFLRTYDPAVLIGSFSIFGYIVGLLWDTKVNNHIGIKDIITIRIYLGILATGAFVGSLMLLNH